jgi:hypothetical protein
MADRTLEKVEEMVFTRRFIVVECAKTRRGDHSA